MITHKGETTDPVTLNINDRFIQNYLKYYHKIDILHPQNAKYSLQKNVIAVSELLPYNKYEQTEFYHDFIKAQGLYDGIGVMLFDHKGKCIGGLGLWKPKKEIFHLKDIELIKLVSKHIQLKLNYYNLFPEDQHQSHALCPYYGNTKRTNNEYLLEQPLTKREEEVVSLVLRGCTNEDIATELFLSLYTVKTHMQNILRKLGVKNRSAIGHALNKKYQERY